MRIKTLTIAAMMIVAAVALARRVRRCRCPLGGGDHAGNVPNPPNVLANLGQKVHFATFAQRKAKSRRQSAIMETEGGFFVVIYVHVVQAL